MLQLRSILDEETDEAKPEILLHRAGFTNREISDLTGKNYEAVKKAVVRAKKSGDEGEP